MDFTVEQFLRMFHRYNEAIWPMQIVGYALGLLIVALLVARVRGSRSFLASRTVVDRLLPALLAAYWTWMGIVFMWGYQADISKSGRPFGVLFLIGAVAFVIAAVVGADLGLGRVATWRLVVGGMMIVYGVALYPLLGSLSGHAYPSAPLFGVAPCPTDIFTLGVLVYCARPRWFLIAVPLIWACIGTMAAVKLSIREDFGLIVSAIVAALIFFWIASPRRLAKRSATALQGN